jgi:hypothetical protein
MTPEVQELAAGRDLVSHRTMRVLFRTVLGPATLASLLLSLAGCGGPRMREGELYAGRPDGPPSIECLPDPDVHDDELTEHMRFGLRLATEALAIEAPAIPSDTSAAAITAWSGGPLQAWHHQKSEAVEAARHELDLAAEESHRQRIMGGAIVGMLYEDVSTTLRAVPTPNDLYDEPEISRIFRDTVEGEARPYVETSRRAYHACEVNGREPSTMRHWANFCSSRLDLLPAPVGEDDVTEVDFFRD